MMIAYSALRTRMAATASVVALTAAVTAGSAYAQGAPAAEQPAQNANTVGEVVVTAQFREQNVQQTPIAITAVNAAMLERRGQTSIDQVANQAPNVSLKPTGAAFGPSLAASIRGVGQYDFNPALEPGVGMYVDDVYYSTLTGSILDLLDLDRVEILRGPQGTLAGKNSIGGAVKLYSKKPTGSGNGYLEVAYGSLNHLEARGSIDFAVVPDKVFARISAVTKSYDGYVDRIDYACAHPGSGLPSQANSPDCKTGEEGGKSYSAVRANVRWLINDKAEFNVIADFTHDHSENPATTLLYANNSNPFISLNGVPYDRRFIPSNPYQSYASFSMPGGQSAIPPLKADAFSAEDKSRYEGWGVSGVLDWKLTDHLAVKAITAGRGYTTDFAEDNDVSPLPLGLGVEHLEHHQFSEEVRFNGTIGDKFDYTFGGFYFWQRTVYATHQDLWYPGIYLDFVGNDPVVAHTKAGFVHGVYHITDKLNLTAGIRYTAEDKSYTFVRQNPDGTPNAILGTLNGLTGHYSGDHVDYRANLDYQWTPDFMTYAQFSTGFKGGGINPRPFVAAQVRPFNAETLEAYELGFKGQFFDRLVRLNGSFFYNKYKDIQLTLLACPQYGGPGPCALPQNAGDANVKGAELETELHPAKGLQIDGSISYLDFDYTRIDPQAGGPSSPTGVQIGMITPFTAKWKASFGIQYEIPLEGWWGSIIPRLDASYEDAVYTNAVNGPLNRIAPHTIGNARLIWRPNAGGWEASFEVTNITDKLYYLGKFDLTGAGAGSVTGTPAMPREWLLRVKKSF